MLFIISSLVITLLVKNRYVKRISITVLLLLIAPKFINATTDEIYEINISFNNAHVNGSLHASSQSFLLGRNDNHQYNLTKGLTVGVNLHIRRT